MKFAWQQNNGKKTKQKTTTIPEKTKQKTKIFGLSPAMTGSNANLNQTCQTYLHTNIFLPSKFACSSLSEIRDLVETTYCSMKIKVCTSFSFTRCILFSFYRTILNSQRKESLLD